jgi:hypothetical protein
MIKRQHPEWLRAMTLHFPWAYLICIGEKEEEFRSRTVSYRGFFLVHAGLSKESDYVIQEAGIPRDRIVRGAIIGAVELFNSFRDSEGAVHQLGVPFLFDEPIGPVSGQQAQLWGAKTPQAIDAFNKAWIKLEALLDAPDDDE